jgi:hypothetical protein
VVNLAIRTRRAYPRPVGAALATLGPVDKETTTVPHTGATVLTTADWQARRSAHERRVDVWVRPHLERHRRREPHPVEDFLFTYYSHRPAALRRWHPGFGTVLETAEEYADLKGYARVSTGSTSEDGPTIGVTVTLEHVALQERLLRGLHHLLTATARRAPQLGCFGMHEWAMVYRLDPSDVRHAAWPLRLGSTGTNQVVDRHRICCSHFDAFRFFTEAARPRNTLAPGRDDRADFEQPGCLHAGMDLYKHAFRLSPMVPSEIVAGCFELARDIRVLDMRASPYDLSGLGYSPVRVETPEGKQEYVAAQRDFAERGAPLRARLITEVERLLACLTVTNRAGGVPATVRPPRPAHTTTAAAGPRRGGRRA